MRDDTVLLTQLAPVHEVLSPCPPIDSQLVSTRPKLRIRTTTPSFSLFSLNPGRKLVPSTKRTRPSKTEGRSISSTVPPATSTTKRCKPQTRTQPADFWNNPSSHSTQELAPSAASSLAASRFTNCYSTKPGCTFRVLSESEPHIAVRQLRSVKKKHLSAKSIYNINNFQSICIKIATDQLRLLDYSPPGSKRGVELCTTITLSLSTVALDERLQLARLEISDQFSKIPTSNRNDLPQAISSDAYFGHPTPELELKKNVVALADLDTPQVRRENPNDTLRCERVLIAFLAGNRNYFGSSSPRDGSNEDYGRENNEGDHTARQEQDSGNSGGTNNAEGNGSGEYNNTSNSQTGTTGSPGIPPQSGSSGGDDGNDKGNTPPINSMHEMDIDLEQEGKDDDNSADEQEENEQRGHEGKEGPEEGQEISQAKLINLAQSAGRFMGSEAPESLPAANTLVALQNGSPVPKPNHFAQDPPNRLPGLPQVTLSNHSLAGFDKSVSISRNISGANREPSSSGEKPTLPSLSSMTPPAMSIKDLAELAINQEHVCSGTPSGSISAAQQVVSLGNPRPVPDTHKQASPASPQSGYGYARKHMTTTNLMHPSSAAQVCYPYQYPSPEEMHSNGAPSNNQPPPYQPGPPQAYPQSRELPNYQSTTPYPYPRDTPTDTQSLRRGSAANMFAQSLYEEHSSTRTEPMVSVAGRDGPNINAQAIPRRNARLGADGGALAAAGFRCKHAGCTAPPFQTQYLLNSHANVHSAERPHFCPILGCPRSEKGRGFKRKNEMIRHGLVHQSPGYICPFCPDREHKYPRPDNLQRHVKVHHPDINRDDTRLREVLSRRPEGGSRGRRRRVGSA